jgi:signal transduction histidine kinase
MKRLRYIWLTFAVCLVLVLAGMAWISRTAIRLERTELKASRQAAVQEKVRLALWRMDSAMAAMIIRESARPYFAYTAFYPVGRAYTRMFAEIKPDEILVPSTLLTYESPSILLHFQFDPSGRLTSPQAPRGNQRDLAETGYLSHERIIAAAERLDRLKAILKRETLLATLTEADATSAALGAAGPIEMARRAGTNREHFMQQAKLSSAERQARNVAARQAARADSLRANRSQETAEVSEGALRPVWIGQVLVLARRVQVGGDEYVQGCWLNWPHVCNWLLTGAKDLFPDADLTPAAAGVGADQPCMLATLPVRLLPGEVPSDVSANAWPIALSLLIAWGCILIGAAAVALVLRGAIRLSERRGAFVSAVTHELRTPLTTFRLYADMLASGMVTDEKQRTDYLDRLRRESERLSHLVENVLAYARLSGPRSGKVFEMVGLGEIVARSRDRLAARTEQAGMTLVVSADETPMQTRVRVNVSSVEQILLNLVDNACRYAARSDDRRIHLELDRHGRYGLIRVRDHGPGVATAEIKRLFRPFHKSAHEAARSAPGVGLGLALSRQLARDMNGDLRLDEQVKDGACFELLLPAESDL